MIIPHARLWSGGLWELPPGKRSFPMHKHYVTEEALFVLSGRAKVRTPDGETDIGPGDYVSFLAGGVAHQLVYDGAESLVYLGLSGVSGPDVVEYPDSGKVGCRTAEDQYRGGDVIEVACWAHCRRYSSRRWSQSSTEPARRWRSSPGDTEDGEPMPSNEPASKQPVGRSVRRDRRSDGGPVATAGSVRRSLIRIRIARDLETVPGVYRDGATNRRTRDF